MAQSVEHVIGNDEVISSILITSSKEGSRKKFHGPFSFVVDDLYPYFLLHRKKVRIVFMSISLGGKKFEKKKIYVTFCPR